MYNTLWQKLQLNCQYSRHLSVLTKYSRLIKVSQKTQKEQAKLCNFFRVNAIVLALRIA